MARNTGIFLPAGMLPREPSPDDWLIPGIIPKNGLVILASAPKTGKTCLATAMAIAVAKGEDFLGKPTPQGPVLWCAHEETMIERKLLHAGLKKDDEFYIAFPDMLPALDVPEAKPDRYGRMRYDENLPYIFEDAVNAEAKLIVIDCLHAAVFRGNLAENALARSVMGKLRRYSAQFQIAILVLHHLTKSATRGHAPERFADSAQILAAASCHFFMEREQETEKTSRITLHGRGRHPAPIAKLELLSQGILDYRIAPPRSAKSEKKRAKDRVREYFEEGWTQTANEVARRLELNPHTVRRYIGELQAEGVIRPMKGAEKSPKYVLTDTSDPKGELLVSGN